MCTSLAKANILCESKHCWRISHGCIIHKIPRPTLPSCHKCLINCWQFPLEHFAICPMKHGNFKGKSFWPSSFKSWSSWRRSFAMSWWKHTFWQRPTLKFSLSCFWNTPVAALNNSQISVVGICFTMQLHAIVKSTDYSRQPSHFCVNQETHSDVGVATILICDILD